MLRQGNPQPNRSDETGRCESAAVSKTIRSTPCNCSAGLIQEDCFYKKRLLSLLLRQAWNRTEFPLSKLGPGYSLHILAAEPFSLRLGQFCTFSPGNPCSNN